MNKVKAFLTVLGATIIANVDNDNENSYQLSSALFLNVQQQQNGIAVGFAPISVVSGGELLKGISFSLQKSHVVLSHEVTDDVAASFAKTTGKIAIATADQVGKLISLDGRK